MAGSTKPTAEHQRNQLCERFPDEVHKQLDKAGRKFTYIPGREVETRLNNVFGPAWSWTVTDTFMLGHGEGGNPTSILCMGQLAVTWADGTHQVIAGEGGVPVKFTTTNPPKPVDLGDELKGAATDALKKAAQRIGVAAYLARSEDAIEAMEQQAANNSQAVDQANEKDTAAKARGYDSHQDSVDCLSLLKSIVDQIPEGGLLRQAWTAWRTHLCPDWPPTKDQYTDLMDRAEAIVNDGETILPGEEPFTDNVGVGEKPWLPAVMDALAGLEGSRKSAVTRMRRRTTPAIGDDPAQWTDEQASSVLAFIDQL